jgi:hypothetical protein
MSILYSDQRTRRTRNDSPIQFALHEINAGLLENSRFLPVDLLYSSDINIVTIFLEIPLLALGRQLRHPD